MLCIGLFFINNTIFMVNKLRQLIRNYFGFSKTETNGFIVLVPLMILMLFLPGIYVSLFSKEYDPYEEDMAMMDSLMTAWNEVVVIKKVSSEIELPPVVSLRPFDPNRVDIDEMRSLGIPAFLSRRIDNYRQKGGKFRRKNDLARIYDFPDSLYDVLKEYIELPDRLVKKKGFVSKYENNKRDTTRSKSSIKNKDSPIALWIDLSNVDTMELRELRGIGPSFSRRIVKYRTLLGGFSNKQQLGEVYGLSDSLYRSLSDQIYVSQPDSVNQIAINIANFKALQSHPYISYKAAREILNMRSKRGKFRSLSDLMVVKELDSAQVLRLGPYISF